MGPIFALLPLRLGLRLDSHIRYSSKNEWTVSPVWSIKNSFGLGEFIISSNLGFRGGIGWSWRLRPDAAGLIFAIRDLQLAIREVAFIIAFGFAGTFASILSFFSRVLARLALAFSSRTAYRFETWVEFGVGSESLDSVDSSMSWDIPDWSFNSYSIGTIGVENLVGFLFLLGRVNTGVVVVGTVMLFFGLPLLFLVGHGCGSFICSGELTMRSSWWSVEGLSCEIGASGGDDKSKWHGMRVVNEDEIEVEDEFIAQDL